MFAQRAFVRRPSPRLAEGIVTHIGRRPVDVGLANVQWWNYVETLRSAGWEAIEVPRADDCPDAAFIEDTLFVYQDLAIVTRPGAPERRPEVPGAEVAARAYGYKVTRILGPGTLDGGDVLKHDQTVWVGVGGRTNAAGAAQLAQHLEPRGATVIQLPVSKVLHLKSAVSALPDGTVIGYDPVVDDPSVFPQYLSMPEEPGSHIVLLNEGRVLMAADAPESAELLRTRGLDVWTVDISEFEKLEGCVTCLSVRLRGM